MPKKESETNVPETDDLATDADPDETTDKGAARFSVVLPAGLARAVRKVAMDENMLISEYMRAVLRGDVKPPEID